jgi:hypothetical protein
MVLANTLAYYDTATIAFLKGFIVKGPVISYPLILLNREVN